jgi:hypothetical protein
MNFLRLASRVSAVNYSALRVSSNMKQNLVDDVALRANLLSQMDDLWGIKLHESELLVDLQDLETKGPTMKVDWDGYAIVWTVTDDEVHGHSGQLPGDVVAARSDVSIP